MPPQLQNVLNLFGTVTYVSGVTTEEQMEQSALGAAS